MSTEDSADEENQPSPLPSLPQEIITECVARAPRSYYSILSLVSNHFRSLVTSPELYARRRSLPSRDDHCLYVAISENQTSSINWYTLSRKPNNKFWLVRIPSLPPMALHGSYVVVGRSILVMGGFFRWGLISPGVFRIDCWSHTVQPLFPMPKAVAGSVCELVDGKIYVIGGSDSGSSEMKSSSGLIMAFDLEAQTWEVWQRPDWEVRQRWFSSVNMSGKIHMRGNKNSYVFEPKEGTWEEDRVLDSKEWSNACVIDNVLYYYDARVNCIRTYDPKERVWGVVKGVELGMFEDGSWSYAVNYGGNLLVFLHKEVALTETTEIWCAEVVVERREEGEIWGRVAWCDLVLDGKFHIMKCLSVKV
ncbi:unnamed protein product [Microthlaspi erraticum]|uniref:F-box domain-containing protein n=1 Tax=Microthlaspi erraticum TaxID=1685480 RepID=A0A6D2JDQ7_9BRAS|nr:unnamed protein product [Microthlaspi erraticum]